MQQQRPQELRTNPGRCAADGRPAVDLAPVVATHLLPILLKRDSRLVLRDHVQIARIEQPSVPAPLPRRSTRSAAKTETFFQDEVLCAALTVIHQLNGGRG